MTRSSFTSPASIRSLKSSSETRLVFCNTPSRILERRNHPERRMEPTPGGRENGNAMGIAAVILRNQPLFRKLLLASIEVGLGTIDFIDRNNYRNPGSLGVVQCLNRLRHHAFVRRYH